MVMHKLVKDKCHHSYNELNAIWHEFLIRKNIDKTDKLLICQNFPYKTFSLAIVNVAPATDSSIFYLSNFLNANLSIFYFHHQKFCHAVFKLLFHITLSVETRFSYIYLIMYPLKILTIRK